MPRKNNGSIESERLLYILSNKGQIMDYLNTTADKSIGKITDISISGGCGSHHDLEFTCNSNGGERKFTVEHKGFTGSSWGNDYTEYKPWSVTPQAFNATYNSFDLGVYYCKMWYYFYIPRIHIALSELNYQVPTPPSTFEQWAKQDASMGSAKSPFGVYLRNNYTDPVISKLLFKYRDHSITKFYSLIRDRPTLMNHFSMEMNSRFSDVIRSKDLWLNIRYDSSSSIEFKLDSDHIRLSVTPSVCDIKSRIVFPPAGGKQLPYVEISYESSLGDESVEITSRLVGPRWGNKTGIANIRWNIS